MTNDEVEKPGEQATGPERSDVRSASVGLVQQETVVLLVDLVESVRLMREHEADAVRRWTDFVRVATAEILVAGGRSVSAFVTYDERQAAAVTATGLPVEMPGRR